MASTLSASVGVQGDAYILSPEQIEAFHREGYVLLDDVISESELAPLEELYQEFMRGDVKDMGRDFCDMSGPYTRAFEDFQIVNAVLPRVYRPELVGNIYERRARSISQQLVGPTATLDYDQFLAKRPRKGRQVRVAPRPGLLADDADRNVDRHGLTGARRRPRR